MSSSVVKDNVRVVRLAASDNTLRNPGYSRRRSYTGTAIYCGLQRKQVFNVGQCPGEDVLRLGHISYHRLAIAAPVTGGGCASVACLIAAQYTKTVQESRHRVRRGVRIKFFVLFKISEWP